MSVRNQESSVFLARVGVQSPNFLTPESESHKTKNPASLDAIDAKADILVLHYSVAV